MFADIQRDYHIMKVEYEEVVWAMAKYREDLYSCKYDLKEVFEVARQHIFSSLLRMRWSMLSSKGIKPRPTW